MNAYVVVGLVCNGMFLFDLILTFNRAYQAPRDKGGRYVYNRRVIARRYLKGWFLVDVVSTIPYDLPLIFLAQSGRDVLNEFQYSIRATSFLKLVRGLKLIPVFRGVIFFLTHRLRVTYAAAEILRLSVFMIFMVHYLACLWTYVGLHYEPSDISAAAGETTWIEKNGMQVYVDLGGYMHRLYAVATFVSIVAVFGGVSSISPNNHYEYVVLSVMMLVGGLCWAYVLSSLCGIFSSLNPHE